MKNHKHIIDHRDTLGLKIASSFLHNLIYFVTLQLKIEQHSSYSLEKPRGLYFRS